MATCGLKWYFSYISQVHVYGSLDWYPGIHIIFSFIRRICLSKQVPWIGLNCSQGHRLFVLYSLFSESPNFLHSTLERNNHHEADTILKTLRCRFSDVCIQAPCALFLPCRKGVFASKENWVIFWGTRTTENKIYISKWMFGRRNLRRLFLRNIDQFQSTDNQIVAFQIINYFLKLSIRSKYDKYFFNSHKNILPK